MLDKLSFVRHIYRSYPNSFFGDLSVLLLWSRCVVSDRIREIPKCCGVEWTRNHIARCSTKSYIAQRVNVVAGLFAGQTAVRKAEIACKPLTRRRLLRPNSCRTDRQINGSERRGRTGEYTKSTWTSSRGKSRTRCSWTLQFRSLISPDSFGGQNSTTSAATSRGTFRVNVSKVLVDGPLCLLLLPLPSIRSAASKFQRDVGGKQNPNTRRANSSSVKCTGSNSSDKSNRISGGDRFRSRTTVSRYDGVFLFVRGGYRYRRSSVPRWSPIEKERMNNRNNEKFSRETLRLIDSQRNKFRNSNII